MKEDLIALYEDALLLGKYTELERVTEQMMPTLHPGKSIEDLSDKELVALIKAVITGMTSWLC